MRQRLARALRACADRLDKRERGSVVININGAWKDISGQVEAGRQIEALLQRYRRASGQ